MDRVDPCRALSVGEAAGRCTRSCMYMCVTRLTGLLNQQPNSHPSFLLLSSTQHPKAYKREDGMTVVHIFKINKDIVQVSREGEVLLDTGGDRGRGVRRAMNNALRKFGFRVTFSADDPEEWTVSDGVRYLQRYEDGMVIPRPNPPGPGRALALLQADPPPFAFAGFCSGFPRRSARGFGTRGVGRSWRGLC